MRWPISGRCLTLSMWRPAAWGWIQCRWLHVSTPWPNCARAECSTAALAGAWRPVLPVHVFGHPARIQELRAVSEAWGLPLVEDAAEALGSWCDGTHCGLFGSVGTLSFNGNKLITTGGEVRSSPITPSWPSERAIFPPRPNFHTPGRLSTMPWVGTIASQTLTPWAWLSWRTLSEDRGRWLAQRYMAAFKNLPSVELVAEPEGCRSNHWLVTCAF